MIDNGQTDRGPIAAKPTLGNLLTWLAESYNNNPYVNREWLPIQVSGNLYKFQCRDAARGYISASTGEPVNTADGNDPAAHWELISTSAARLAGETKAAKTKDSGLVMEDLNPQFTVYPNPSAGILNIRWGGIDRAEIHLYSMEGRLMLKKEYAGGVLQIDTHQNMKSGMYLLRSISDNGSIETRKIVIK